MAVYECEAYTIQETEEIRRTVNEMMFLKNCKLHVKRNADISGNLMQYLFWILIPNRIKNITGLMGKYH